MNRFVVCDPARCIGCGVCRVTCSESHRKRWMRPAARLSLVKTRAVTAAVTCHQCEGAPCMAVCPEAAISLVRDHVHIDEELCTGCLLCALACPFGAVYPSAPSDAPAKATPYGRASSSRSAGLLRQKETGRYASVVACDLCAKVPGGPRCIVSCPTKALSLVDECTLTHLVRDRRLEAIEKAGVAMRGAKEAEREVPAHHGAASAARADDNAAAELPRKALTPHGARMRRGTRKERGNERGHRQAASRFRPLHRVRRLRRGLRHARHPHLRRRGRRAVGVDARPDRLHLVRPLRAGVPDWGHALVTDSDFADDPEPPKRCLFALRECASCGRYYATNKEVEYANALLDQAEHVDAAHARLLTSVCPDCKRRRDAQAASRRCGLGSF